MKPISRLAIFTLSTPVVLISAVLPTSLWAQVALQPFMEVEGTGSETYLGLNVYGINPTHNVPFNVAVSYYYAQFGQMQFYSISSPLDTIQRTLPGQELAVGDLNGDRFTDLVTMKDHSSYDTVFVFWGTETWVDTTNPLIIPRYQEDVGFPCVGDVNNDGHDDLIVPCPGFDYLRGRVSFFYGPEISSEPDEEIFGDTTNSYLGEEVFVADLNDDLLKDIVVYGREGFYTIDTSYIRIYWGCGVDTICKDNYTELRGDADNIWGIAVFDANGDGVDDLLWARRDTVGYCERIFIYYGGASFDTTPDMVLLNPAPLCYFTKIGNAGDMNGDGYDDIIGGIPYGTITSGFVFVYGGGPDIDPYFDAAVGKNTDGYFGWSFSSVGDVNGDRLGDIIVSAPWDKFQQAKGYWGIFLGDDNIIVSDVAEGPAVPNDYRLYAAYPNPFNPSTTIDYALPRSSYVKLEVFNVLGERVRTLLNDVQHAGYHSVVLNAERLPSGVYFYRIQAGSFIETRKLILLR